jgi:hypothetical protein
MSTAKLLASLGVIVLICGGCEYRMGDFTVLSTKNVYAHGVDVTKLEKRTAVEGQEGMKFLGIGANPKNAVDKVLENGNGNAAINAVIYYDYFFLFGRFRAKGDVVDLPYAAQDSQPSPAGMAR